MSTKIYLQFVLILFVLVSQLFGPRPAAFAYQTSGVSSDVRALSGGLRLELTEKELVAFVALDVNKFWAEVFAQAGLRYTEPKIFYVSTSSNLKTACGTVNTSVGPFYCSEDSSVYFIKSGLWDAGLHGSVEETGDFATALIVAHEISHHVQYLLGISDAVAKRQERLGSDQESINRLDRYFELEADCFAGMWGNTARARGMMEDGDLEEGIRILHHIGDDSVGVNDPGNYTHGSAQERMAWFLVGYMNGNVGMCDAIKAEGVLPHHADPITSFFVNASQKSCKLVDDGVAETVRTIRCVFKDNGHTFKVDYDEWSSERAWMNNLSEWSQSDDLVVERSWRSSGTGGYKGPYLIVGSENQTSTLLWGVSGTKLTGTIYWYDDDYDSLKNWFLEYGNTHNAR